MSRGKRTSISKEVCNDRIITCFQGAYNELKTVHQQLGFSPQVRDATTSNKTGNVGLKICKAVLVGNMSVGKSCLVNRFCHDIFDREYKATIGVDFEVEKFSVLSTPFNLQIWDTAGEERFKSIAASYYRGAHLVMVVFDMSDISSLMSCRRWQEEACDKADDPLVFLIGTKRDLVSESSCNDVEEKAWQIAQEMNAEYWTVSAKTGEGVKDLFFRAVCLTFDKIVLRELGSLNSQPKQIGAINTDLSLVSYVLHIVFGKNDLSHVGMNEGQPDRP